MQMNPQLMSLLKSNGNPQQMAINMMQASAQNNPMLANLLTLAKEGKGNDIEAIAKTMLKSQGFDFDKEFNEFQQMMGFK